MASEMVSPAFAALLRADREVFNEKFAEARRRRPDLDGGALLAFLRASGDRVVAAAAAVAAGRESEVAHAAYDAALTLIGEKLAGPGGRCPIIDEAWQRLLPAVAHLVADQPVRVIGSLTNAVFHLAGTPGARPDEWIELLVRAAPSLSSVADLLTAGQVAAWRSGLAHLRVGALAAGDGLEPRIAAALLGAPRGEWHALRDCLLRDAWWHPDASEEPRPRVARVVGAFRGFGGPFAEPPRVAALDGMLAVSAGGEAWILSADAFGATLQRIDPSVLATKRSNRRVKAGSVAHDGKALPLPAIGAVTSVAAVPGTVAVTGAMTHTVTLIAVDPA